LVPIPWFLAEIQGSVLGMLPNSLLTRDQVTLLKSDNVVSEAAIKEGRTLPGLGIMPQSTEVILPSYLWRFRPSGQFAQKSEA
ncbi:MAG: complex I NDUFA9 subunit family protein, partial [Rhizobiaceae bacterium]|nr:complex I NDUFA9 subunit family protein [Rhizobiaceae bacterium]